MRPVLLLILALAWLSACTHHPRRVDCDQHLEAINPAHSKVKPDAAKAP
jgi:hypothetical protein